MVACVCLFLFVGIALAQQGKPTRIVITLNDGKTVSGELIGATPAGVTVKPNPKADDVMTPWSSIKRVGNGLTRQKIVDEWRKTKHELLCDVCDGSGATTCPTCNGTGVDPAQKQNCAKCEGTGSLGKCKTANCVGGMIPCPDTCLKESSFSGVRDKDGKLWRKFRGKNGSVLSVSDAHVGQRVLYVDGNPQLIESPCPTCGGTTKIKDPACNGTGKTICPDCHGHGVVGPKCPNCVDGEVKCATSDGTGLKKAA
jgi:hypothetical protein